MRIAPFAAALLLIAPAAFVQAQSPAAAAHKPAAAGSIRPGTYDIELAIGGGVLKGTLELTAIGDSLAAKIGVGDHAPPPIRSIKRNGTQLAINAGDTGVDVAYDLRFDGDAVTGKFTFNGDPGLISGKRRK